MFELFCSITLIILNQILLPGFVVLQRKHLPKLQHQPASISAVKMKSLRYQMFANYAKRIRYFF